MLRGESHIVKQIDLPLSDCVHHEVECSPQWDVCHPFTGVPLRDHTVRRWRRPERLDWPGRHRISQFVRNTYEMLTFTGAVGDPR